MHAPAVTLADRGVLPSRCAPRRIQRCSLPGTRFNPGDGNERIKFGAAWGSVPVACIVDQRLVPPLDFYFCRGELTRTVSGHPPVPLPGSPQSTALDLVGIAQLANKFKKIRMTTEKEERKERLMDCGKPLAVRFLPLDLLSSGPLCFPFNDPARSYDESVPLYTSPAHLSIFHLSPHPASSLPILHQIRPLSSPQLSSLSPPNPNCQTPSCPSPLRFQIYLNRYATRLLSLSLPLFHPL